MHVPLLFFWEVRGGGVINLMMVILCLNERHTVSLF